MQYFAVDWLDVIGGEDAVNALINGALTGHTHDDRYYTKSEIDAGYAKLSGGNSFSGNQSIAGNLNIANLCSISIDGGLSSSFQNVGGFLSIGNLFGGNGTRFRHNDGTEWARFVSPSGRFLLGTTTDNGSALLQVAGSITASGNITTGYVVNTPSQSSVAGTLLGSTGNGPWIRGSGAAYTVSRSDSQTSATLYFYGIGGETVQAVGRFGIGGIVQGPNVFLSATSAGNVSLLGSDGTTAGNLSAGTVTASGISYASGGFRTHTTNNGFVATTFGMYCMLDTTNGWTLQRQGTNGVVKACNIQETAGVCLDFSTDDTLTIKSRANAVNARLSVPGSFHTVTIGPADSTFGANMTAGNQLLFHSTVYGAKAAIGFNNAGAFQINNVLLGPSSVFNQLTALLGYSYAPAFCTDATSSQEKGMFSSAGVLYLTVNRGNQLAVDGTGVSIAGLLTASGVITSGFRSLTANPTTIDIASGREQLVKNTTNGELRRWANDGGTMKSLLYA